MIPGAFSKEISPQYTSVNLHTIDESNFARISRTKRRVTLCAGPSSGFGGIKVGVVW